MEAISANHADFAARVGRIERNIADARQLLWVGIDEVYAMPRRERKPKVTGLRAMMQNAMYPLSIVAAVVLGAVSHGVGQVARYHVQGLPDPKANPDIETLVQVILGIVISIALGYVFRLQSKSFMTLKSTGVIVGVLFFHNAVHLYPKAFSAVTSPMWVNYFVTQTQAHSMMWRGISFVF